MFRARCLAWHSFLLCVHCATVKTAPSPSDTLGTVDLATFTAGSILALAIQTVRLVAMETIGTHTDFTAKASTLVAILLSIVKMRAIFAFFDKEPNQIALRFLVLPSDDVQQMGQRIHFCMNDYCA